MRYLYAQKKSTVKEIFDTYDLSGKRGGRNYCFISTFYCLNCATELYCESEGTSTTVNVQYDGKMWDAYDLRMKRKRVADYVDAYHPTKEAELRSIDRALEKYGEIEALNHKSRTDAENAYDKMVAITHCPICGAPLRREKGFFLPGFSYKHSDEERLKYFERLPGDHAIFFGYPKTVDDHFTLMASYREKYLQGEAKARAQACKRRLDLPAFVAETKTDMIESSPAELKKYILHLIRLENNIYFLEEHLYQLYYLDCQLPFEDYTPVIRKKQERASLNDAYKQALADLEKARQYNPSAQLMQYPKEPVMPTLETPGLFNKKRVQAENEALTQKYNADMIRYQERVRQYHIQKEYEEKKHAQMVANAEESARNAKNAWMQANQESERVGAMLAQLPSPVKAAKELVAREIAEAETLMAKTLEARNALYAQEVIFGKYRNAVALSSFYEYLMSGRCTALPGPDGAYNIYEGEVRANQIITQLDTVISSLESIQQNQYMMYMELRNIRSSLSELNASMCKAVDSIQSIQHYTANMSDLLTNISRNSDVIAHNSAVTAYYSKVNAELTNALGFMIALK